VLGTFTAPVSSQSPAAPSSISAVKLRGSILRRCNAWLLSYPYIFHISDRHKKNFSKPCNLWNVVKERKNWLKTNFSDRFSNPSSINLITPAIIDCINMCVSNRRIALFISLQQEILCQ
jgi:hypothetical protein